MTHVGRNIRARGVSDTIAVFLGWANIGFFSGLFIWLLFYCGWGVVGLS